jgi:hypothetical protein
MNYWWSLSERLGAGFAVVNMMAMNFVNGAKFGDRHRVSRPECLVGFKEAVVA